MGARPVLDEFSEDVAGFSQVAASVEHSRDVQVVLGPQFDFVEIPVVRIQRVVVSSSDQRDLAAVITCPNPLLLRALPLAQPGS